MAVAFALRSVLLLLRIGASLQQLIGPINGPFAPAFPIQVDPTFLRQADPCFEARKNVTDVITLPRHKYVVLEQCLYYYLQRKADNDYQKPSALFLLPPGKDVPHDVNISISQAILQNLYLNDMLRDSRLRGYFSVQWTDERLMWDPAEWKLSEMKIEVPGHIWIPDMTSDKHESALATTDFYEFKNIRVNAKGSVTAHINFNLQTTCSVDTENYPFDQYYCCYTMTPNIYSEIIRLRPRTATGTLDVKHFYSHGWTVESAQLALDSSSDNADLLSLCLSVTRHASTMRAELVLPMVFCGLLVLIAPLFGAFKLQLYIKLYALLLQYLCLQYLVSHSSHLTLATHTPKVVKFYELTISTTMLSLIITLVFWLFERRQCRLPPPQSLARVARVLNCCLCCFTSSARVPSNCVEPASAEKASITDGLKNYHSDWLSVYQAMHAVASLLLVVIYLAGIAICFS